MEALPETGAESLDVLAVCLYAIVFRDTTCWRR